MFNRQFSVACCPTTSIVFISGVAALTISIFASRSSGSSRIFRRLETFGNMVHDDVQHNQRQVFALGGFESTVSIVRAVSTVYPYASNRSRFDATKSIIIYQGRIVFPAFHKPLLIYNPHPRSEGSTIEGRSRFEISSAFRSRIHFEAFAFISGRGVHFSTGRPYPVNRLHGKH